jgi:hypothetical protein
MGTKKPEDENTPTATSSAAELLTPLEWAQRKELVGRLDPLRPWEPPHKKPSYAAADTLHGWTQDAYDYQAEDQLLKLSEADFDAALVAAGKYPAAPAHAAACGRNFKQRAEPVRHPTTKAVLAEGKTVHAPNLKAVKTDG